VGGLRKDGPELFKQRYRELDALLIDDVQALEGKERTQEEFVHTFNALHAAGKQIVLSSDRPPEAIARVAERLRDRFGWGLCAELAAPDLRTRTALLWRMTVEGPVELGDPAGLKEIAGRVVGNVRRLQGAMTRVAAFSSMLSEPVTPSLAQHALDSVPAEESRLSPAEVDAADTARVHAIQEAICSVYSVSRDDLLSAKRSSRISHARQLAMYLAREETSISLAQIARAFNRDHTTVLHAIRAVAGRLEPGSDTIVSLHRTRELLTKAPSRATTGPPAIHSRPESPPPASHEASAQRLP
jgi:chromosomal replication initiator protein